MAIKKERSEVIYTVSSDKTGKYVCDVIVNELEKRIKIDLQHGPSDAYKRVFEQLSLCNMPYSGICYVGLYINYKTEVELEHVLGVLSKTE